MQNCRHLKKRPVKGLCGRCLSVWGPEPHTPPPYTQYVRVVNILIHKGKGGKVEGERQQFTKLGRKYQHEWLHLQSINSDPTMRGNIEVPSYMYYPMNWCKKTLKTLKMITIKLFYNCSQLNYKIQFSIRKLAAAQKYYRTFLTFFN